MYRPRLYNLARIIRPLVVVCAVVFSTVCTSGSVLAQSAPFRAVDTNGDQVLSYDELVRAFGRASARRLLRQSDLNGDGVISIQELRRNSRSNSLDKDAPNSTAKDDDREDDQRDDDRDDDDKDDDNDKDDGGDDDDNDD